MLYVLVSKQNGVPMSQHDTRQHIPPPINLAHQWKQISSSGHRWFGTSLGLHRCPLCKLNLKTAPKGNPAGSGCLSGSQRTMPRAAPCPIPDLGPGRQQKRMVTGKQCTCTHSRQGPKSRQPCKVCCLKSCLACIQPWRHQHHHGPGAAQPVSAAK